MVVQDIEGVYDPMDVDLAVFYACEIRVPQSSQYAALRPPEIISFMNG